MLFKTVPILAVKSGMILASDVISNNGTVLLAQGQHLTADNIAYLRVWNIDFINIVTGLNAAVYDHRIPCEQEEFNKFYHETLQIVKTVFEHTYLSQNIPLATLNSLVDCHIKALIDTHGAIELLYKIHTHCDYTYRHSINVAVIAGILGKHLGMKVSQLRKVIMGGLLHDLGKLWIERAILNKPGNLTNEEMVVIKNHPSLGHQLITSVRLSKDVALAVLQHHERIDGSGYPFGLDQEKISFNAKVLAVADIYDAMTTDRCYRAKVTPLCAAETITKQMFKQFDPGICMTFLKIIKTNLSDSPVLLNNGRKGIVVYLHNTPLDRPIVRLADGTFVDLLKDKEVKIVAFENQ